MSYQEKGLFNQALHIPLPFFLTGLSGASAQHDESILCQGGHYLDGIGTASLGVCEGVETLSSAPTISILRYASFLPPFPYTHRPSLQWYGEIYFYLSFCFVSWPNPVTLTIYS